MNLSELVKIASSEEKAEEFLRSRGILKTFENCSFCKSESIGKVRRNFYKCYGCRREWSIRRGSILLSKFILAIKLFILEVPVNKTYKELGISYNTTHKIYQRIRKAIYDFVLREDEVLKGAIDKIPVFGILERNGKVKVEIVEDVSA